MRDKKIIKPLLLFRARDQPSIVMQSSIRSQTHNICLQDLIRHTVKFYHSLTELGTVLKSFAAKPTWRQSIVSSEQLSLCCCVFFLIEWNTNTHFPIIFTTYGWKVFLSIKVARRCCSCRRYQELLQTVSWIFISVKSLKAIASFRRWKCHQFFKVLQQLESMRSNSKREVLG